jgi:hypothetical protein
MKKLIVLLGLLAFPAQAQEYRVIYGGDPESGLVRNILAINTSGAKYLTGSFGPHINYIRVSCSNISDTAGCYFAVVPTGSGRVGTVLTGFFLQDTESMILRVSPGDTVSALTSTDTANLHVHELTK